MEQDLPDRDIITSPVLAIDPDGSSTLTAIFGSSLLKTLSAISDPAITQFSFAMIVPLDRELLSMKKFEVMSPASPRSSFKAISIRVSNMELSFIQ